VSPRWVERLDVVLAPHRVTCVHTTSPPWRPRPPHAALQVEPEAKVPAWGGAVAALKGWIDQQATRPGTKLSVVLSNHFVRLLLLPWRDDLVSSAERLALASRALEARYGDDADGWSIRLGACRYGEAALVCAIDEALLAALKGVCADRGLRLASVQPLLCVAYDAHASRLPADAGLFVVEPGRVTSVVLDDGACQSVRSLRLDGAGWPDAWLDRQADLMGLASNRPRCVLVAAQAAQPTLAAWSTTRSAPAGLGRLSRWGDIGRGEAARLWSLAAEANA
jgi:hypothetical protein